MLSFFKKIELAPENCSTSGAHDSTSQASENKYKALFMSSRDAIMTLEPPSWNFTSCNPAAIAMFKAKDQADFTRHEPWILSPEFQPDGRSSMEKALEMIEKAMKEGVNFFEWTHKRLDGREFSAEVLLSRIDGEHPYLHALVRDITERKMLEEKARENAEQRFEVIFNGTNDGIALADPKTYQIILANDSFRHMLGYTPEDAQDLNISDVHLKEDLPYTLEQFEKQVRGEIRVAENIKMKRKDGSIFYCDVNSSMVTFEGNKYLLGIFRDVTDRKIGEETEGKHMKELENINKILVGRELKMIELKKEITQLQHKGGSHVA